MSLCLCTDDAPAACSGGGLPPTGLGDCSCDCHRPVLRERWPLATPAVDPVRYAAFSVRANFYSHAALGSLSADPAQAAISLCYVLQELPPLDRARVIASIGASGAAAALSGALLRTALLMARARVTAGLLAAGGVP